MGENASGTDPLDRYLRTLERELAPLPAEERRDIVAETRSHILDRMTARPDAGMHDVLNELGDPARHARRFTGVPEDAPGPVRTMVRLAARGFSAFAALNALVAAYGVALLLLALAVAKVVVPERVGLFIDPEGRTVTFGVVAGDAAGHDVLGWWLLPLALLAAAAVYAGTTALLRRILRWRRERSSTRTGPAAGSGGRNPGPAAS